ncbi:hypothetical protein E2C01_065876 [Portunus trituberculatus]|uniref:Uncharacterized protein n=1 Tax=Portunus trituberculatus TaxID=210409 RepID=A0A5B7HT15_PORTR|nr:hypothetical protein [Portunus trituberculatus]
MPWRSLRHPQAFHGVARRTQGSNFQAKVLGHKILGQREFLSVKDAPKDPISDMNAWEDWKEGRTPKFY